MFTQSATKKEIWICYVYFRANNSCDVVHTKNFLQKMGSNTFMSLLNPNFMQNISISPRH